MSVDVTELLKLVNTSIGDGILPEPELLTYYKNLEDRMFWIDYEIETSLLEISKYIIQFNQEDKDIPIENRKPIKLFIFSYGGDLDVCFNLIDFCLASKTPIYTINAGVAMSGGLLLLLCGSKRFALKRAQALIHSGSSGIEGTFEQTQENMKNYRKLVQIMHDFILERTTIDKNLFARKKSKEWYLDSNEMLKYNIATNIINSIDEII